MRLLETTFIRVGKIEYAKQNDSFGLTTLRNRHVDIEGSPSGFGFAGKAAWFTMSQSKIVALRAW